MCTLRSTRSSLHLLDLAVHEQCAWGWPVARASAMSVLCGQYGVGERLKRVQDLPACQRAAEEPGSVGVAARCRIHLIIRLA